ncbi:MAG: hypothetical protein HQL95_00650 [Magnetococcales bacterium]|nr:hypothetical protein [Magnetococcales bacterium]
MANHRYWRLYITSTNHADGVSLKINKIAFAVFNDFFIYDPQNINVSPSNEFNNVFSMQNYSGLWFADSAEKWVSYDFIYAVDVIEIDIRCMDEGFTPRNLELQFSDDTITWEKKFSWFDQLPTMQWNFFREQESNEFTGCRYWKLRIHTTNSQDFVSATIREIEFRGSIGGEDLTSSNINAVTNYPSNQTENIFNNNTGDYWYADTMPRWVVYDFGVDNNSVKVIVREVAIYCIDNNTPKDFTLYCSNDGYSWVDAIDWRETTDYTYGFNAFNKNNAVWYHHNIYGTSQFYSIVDDACNTSESLTGKMIAGESLEGVVSCTSALDNAVAILREAADGMNVSESPASQRFLAIAINELQFLSGMLDPQSIISQTATEGATLDGVVISWLQILREAMDGLSVSDTSQGMLSFVLSELQILATTLEQQRRLSHTVTGGIVMAGTAGSWMRILRDAVAGMSVADDSQSRLSFAIQELQTFVGTCEQQGRLANAVTGGMALSGNVLIGSALLHIKEVMDGLSLEDASRSWLSFVVAELEGIQESLNALGKCSPMVTGDVSFSAVSTSVFRVLRTVLDSATLDDASRCALALAIAELQNSDASVASMARKSNLVTGTLNLKGTVSLAAGLLLAVAESVILTDSTAIQAPRMVLVLDRFGILDSNRANLMANTTVTSGMSSSEAVRVAMYAFSQDAATWTSSCDEIRLKALLVAESLVLSGAVGSLLHARIIVAAALTLQDATIGHRGFHDQAIENIVLSEALLRLWVHHATALDTMLLADSVAKTARLQIALQDEFRFQDTVSPGAVFKELMADGVKIFLTFSHDDDAVYSGFVLNTKNLAVSEYANFRFNSITTWNGLVCMANSSGIFFMSDNNDDDGLKIQSMIRTGLMDFGSDHLKRIQEAFIGIRGNGQMILKTITGDAKENWYDLRVLRSNPGKNRIKLGRGVSSLFWQFELQNTGGETFEMKELTLYPVALSRRER